VSSAAIILVGALAVSGLWYWSTSTREKVIAIADEICRELRVQRLNGSVALKKVRVVRPLTLERCYEFEFSLDGADRRLGQVVLLGSALLRARLEFPDGPLNIEVDAAPDRGTSA